MFFPIWLLATIIFIVLVVVTVCIALHKMSAYDFATPIIALIFLFLEIVAYLIFWIVFLAL